MASEIEKLAAKIEPQLKHASPAARAYERPMDWDEAAALLAALRAAEAERDSLKEAIRRGCEEIRSQKWEGLPYGCERAIDAELALKKAEAERDEARAALEPFAAVAEHDIGTDETDADLFRPMQSHNRAPRLTVGDLRKARAALQSTSAKEGE